MFPVVDIDGKLIESKKFLWGLPVMNYLELVAVVGIITSVLDGLLDMSTGLGFPLLQIFETTAYFIVIRTEDQTSSWYVLSMLFVGVGIILRIVLHIAVFGLPALLESQDKLKSRLHGESAFRFFIPSGTTVVTDDVVLDVRRNLIFLVVRSIVVVVVACCLFTFIERARELTKYRKRDQEPA
ncbi:hypothetical protein DdX_06605 [Ditylenchus destructor]|uniref:Uncharacterized protein n=1 Tax=Ditylenchus destructor TaxID=166010 RepID=A0AAD4R5V8_9BILA|nr:hypothetical protein DdX_06605 [Ditylenchus destructor]